MDGIEWRITGSMLLNVCQQFQPFIRRDGVAPFERADSVPARRSAERRLVGPPAANPDGNARRLNGCRPEGHFFYIVLVVLVAEWLSRPQASQNLQPFIEPPGTRFGIGRLVEETKIPLGRVAQPNSKDEPSVRESVY